MCICRLADMANFSDTEKINILFNEHPRMLGKYIRKIFIQRKSILFN